MPEDPLADDEFVAYIHPSWDPNFRPALPTRDWMDATPQSFAYRCLPLAVANSHGWEIACPAAFSATWDGSVGTSAVKIEMDHPDTAMSRPTSIFGSGVLTFHVYGLMRTPPGWNLWIGGSPNAIKDGIQPLTGVIETDWSPFSFTMNWRFTRAHHPIRFEVGDACAFFFPIPRGVVSRFQPQYRHLAENPDLADQFQRWSRSRDAFQTEVARNPPKTAAAAWQKVYFKGEDMAGKVHAEHETKIRARPFRPLGS